MKETQLDGESLDIVSDNVSKLKEIFPEVITEDKIDFDKLKLILGSDIDTDSERYSFTWPGKTQAIKESQKQSTGTLRPCKEESKNWETTKNLYIEGDNLEVLKLLQKSYFNKVKMIYIDPPYNTGNDFVYNDDYSDNLENYLQITEQKNEGKKLSTNTDTEGRFHSNWLNMMYPRLKLARNLLKDDGVIFISIDDNEVENLKKICNEIFGEGNFLSNIIWQSRTSISNDQPISLNHNHTLVYCKDINSLLFGGEPLDMSDYDNSDNDPRGPWKLVPIDANKVGGNTVYPILNPYTNEEYYPPNGRIWAYNPEEYKKLFDDGRIKFGKNNMSSPKKKLYYNERIEKGDRKTPSSILTSVGTTKNGTTEIMELFDNKKIFSYPKPSSFISKLIDYAINNYKNSEIILDFFSGSGTTAVSVFKNNINQNANLSFLMIQIPEPTDEKSIAIKEGYKNICEIGKERIRRAGDKIVEESGNKDLDIGFKVFKLDSSNLNKWDPDYDNLEQTLLVSQDNIKPDRTQEDLIYEIMLKYGIDLTLPIEEYDVGENKIYSIGFGALLICLDNKITKDITDSIIELASEDVSRVVFKDNGFASDADKTNIKETLRTHNIDEFITI